MTYLFRHLRVTADLNNMSWKVRPEEVFIEVGKQFGSKIGLQQFTEVTAIFTYLLYKLY